MTCLALVPASLSASVVDCDFGHPILPRPAARIVTPGGGFMVFTAERWTWANGPGSTGI